ncbi:MAG: class I SAM-dependent methyltransferase [Saprospiraceae bacterium]|nr:class I SAM-dependent methyltransferase [Saprospiraceae bacterium]
MELKNILKQVEVVFPFEKIDTLVLNEKYTNNYYGASSIGYKIFHSNSGSVHMALSQDDTFKEEDYLAQVLIIEKYLNEVSNKVIKVLELGCGKGFNIQYLASKFDNIQFIGIDITKEHLKQAIKRNELNKNVSLRFMSFDDFTFEAEQFDLIFEIEAICHSVNQKKLISSIHNLLKKDGKFIAFEGFRNTFERSISADENKLLNYIEKSMAVAKGVEIKEWLEDFNSIFSNVEANDISFKIVPNLKRLNILSGKYFSKLSFAKFINLFASEKLVMNAIAGYLMLYSVENKYHVYYHIEGKK